MDPAAGEDHGVHLLVGLRRIEDGLLAAVRSISADSAPSACRRAVESG